MTSEPELLNWYAARVAHHAPRLIAAAFVLLAVVYSLVTPIFEGPDEIWHYAFADHLANGGGLPVFDLTQPATWLRNGAHPPLYYWLVAALIAPIDRSDFPTEYHFNLASPKITPGGQGDSPNLMVHTAREDFPYRGTALAVHMARLVSIALGVLTLIGVWQVAKRLLANHLPLAIAVLGLAAFAPQFVYGSAIVNNDALASASATWTLYALLRLKDNMSVRWTIIVGLLLGVTLLSKIGMVAILPLPVLALLLSGGIGHKDTSLHQDAGQAARRTLGDWVSSWFRSRTWKRIIGLGLIVYGFAFAVAGWWYIRNWILYGDPLAWREWQVLTGVGRVPPTLGDFAHDMLGLFGMFWADFALRVDRVLAPVFGLIAIVAVFGLVRRALRREWPLLDWAGLLIGTAWLGLLLASAMRYSLLIYDIHGRLLYPALAVIGVLLALGLSGWPRRAGRYAILATSAFLFAFGFIAPFAIIQPAYARPIVSALPDGVTPASAHFGVVELIGYRVKSDRVKAGEAIELATYWRRMRPAGSSDQSILRAVVTLPTLQSGALLGRAEVVLGTDAYPSWAWQPDEIVETDLRLAANVNASAVGLLQLGVRGDTAKLITSETGDTIELGRVIVQASASCDRLTAADATFGGIIHLAGYRIEQSTTAGEAPRVILCWKSLKPTATDYTVFVHVTDENGDMFAADAQPHGGTYPTSAWESGEWIEDEHPLPTIDTSTVKRVSIGLYRLDTGERLSIDGTNETEFVITK